MFERYTEDARRVLFYARYEASELGGVAIESDHILLGLLRRATGLTGEIFARAQVSYDDVRARIHARLGVCEKVGTSVEIPFSAETKRVLQYAAEEADRLKHNDIGPQHLLLGLLREDQASATSILTKHGLQSAAVREEIAKQPSEKGGSEL